MIQLKIILFGLTIVGAVALAVYNHYNAQEAPQQYRATRQPMAKRRRRSPSPPVSICSEDSSSGPKSLPQCSICCAALVSDDIYVKKLNCGHMFHKVCIDPWFNVKKTCPNCRRHVD